MLKTICSKKKFIILAITYKSASVTSLNFRHLWKQLRTFSKAVPIPYQYPNRPPKTRQETTSVNKKTLNHEEIIVARQCIEEQTPENQATSDDTFGEQTPKAIEKNICEIIKTS